MSDFPKTIAMVPARMGSQRLKQKNLRPLHGVPLITRAIRKCKEAAVFDEIWVNSEHEAFGEIAAEEGVLFHQRPEELGDKHATSEQFVYEFLTRRACDYVVQVHSIAPLLTTQEVRNFTLNLQESEYDILLSCIHDQIECAYENKPINFTYAEKTNSQELKPVQRITWSITGWDAKKYIAAYEKGECATYAGHIGFFQVSAISGHVIKTLEDFQIAEALYPVIHGSNSE